MENKQFTYFECSSFEQYRKAWNEPHLPQGYQMTWQPLIIPIET